VEGFVRQILGWREYVRGIYWTQMPGYRESNALDAGEDLPAWYWSGDTDMACLRDAITQTLRHGYAHHIQRLMVTGLYALLLGVAPKQIHAWYLAVYVDAVEWVLAAVQTLCVAHRAAGVRQGAHPRTRPSEEAALKRDPKSEGWIPTPGGNCLSQCHSGPTTKSPDLSTEASVGWSGSPRL
jgi:deoxyribodipyrimidine photolyase-like uncharacterized protein